jgi:hypothetical protein
MTVGKYKPRMTCSKDASYLVCIISSPILHLACVVECPEADGLAVKQVMCKLIWILGPVYMVHSSMSVGRVVEVATGDTVLYKSGERAALQFHKLYLHTGPP